MRIRWLGHACFLIETEQGRVVTDPFDPSVGYPAPKVAADVVTVSHSHYDHSAVENVKGNPVVVNTSGLSEVGGIKIKGIRTFHDKKEGKLRGQNLVFVLEAEGLRVAHLGDLGHLLDSDQKAELGEIDILLIPVGGTYTIDAEEAYKLAGDVKAKVVIPMHYKTPHCAIDIGPVERFTQYYPEVVKMPYLEVNRTNLRDLPGVVVLDYQQG